MSRNIGDLVRDRFWQPNSATTEFEIQCITNHMFPISERNGSLSAYTHVNKFGRVLNYGTSIVDVNDQSTPSVYSWPTSPVTLEAISTSADDTAAGDGARTIVVQGLDANWEEQESTITMAGASASTATSESYIRIHRAYVATAGTYAATNAGGNAGVITIRTSSAGQTHIQLLTTVTGLGQSLVTRYTIPSGKTGYLIHAAFSNAAVVNKSSDFYLFRRENGDDSTAPVSSKRIIETFNGISSYFDREWTVPIKLPEKTDIWVAAIGEGSGTNSSATFDMIMTNN